eukprot:gnl/TRDRNA2_/TRDRNA2_131778_c0_seq2.p1 gnl/TRDRNA2_/TRDRNA2_131778_c0~~gnl/TRDRNA2_/TRDRNA2_131778_c0_seq2.p1  ORF type:complete len:411 (+),score=64.57 gnl/TRDRNA2_/TRDRNA2_131778_c0_seq2:71-1303(+)
MPFHVDPSRIQGFGSDSIPSTQQDGDAKGSKATDGSTSSFWSWNRGFKDQMTSPAVSSAMDNITVRMSNAWEAATQDFGEMAQGIKALGHDLLPGLGDRVPDQEEEEQEAQDDVPVSPRQRTEALQIIGHFCDSYKASRVAPSTVELDDLCARCSLLQLQPPALAAALYEQFSFASGDLQWQPRLRALYLLEHLHNTDSLASKETASMVTAQAEPLLQHLAMEVPECKEKATHVIMVLLNMTPMPGEGSTASSETSATAQTEGAAPSSPDKTTSPGQVYPLVYSSGSKQASETTPTKSAHHVEPLSEVDSAPPAPPPTVAPAPVQASVATTYPSVSSTASAKPKAKSPSKAADRVPLVEFWPQPEPQQLRPQSECLIDMWAQPAPTSASSAPLGEDDPFYPNLSSGVLCF